MVIVNMKRVKFLFKKWLHGIGFATFLTVILIIAKLMHHLTWTWWMTSSPLWLSFAFTFSVPILGSIGVGFLSLLTWIFDRNE
jgi:hypothetical protein